MTTVQAQPVNLGLLSKLPSELRDQIYRYHLVLPKSIRMKPRKSPSVFASHMAICKTNRHVKDRGVGSLECINPISGDTQVISCPSRLALLATCKTIYHEAVHIYYRQNHLDFDSVARLQDFITSCQTRYHFMGDISLRYWLISHSADVFCALMDCQYLKTMCIGFHHKWTSYGEPLVLDAGICSLRELRGIKTLELSGKDQVDLGEGQFEEVDLDDPRALGPILRRELTRPREEISVLSLSSWA